MIPQTKLDEILLESEKWSTFTKATKKQLQSLVGKLKHIGTCIPFFARILSELRLAPTSGYHEFSKNLLKDISWFCNSARRYNGARLLPTKEKTTWLIECDSTLQGGGAYSQEKYYHQKYNKDLTDKSLHITHLEALNLLHALKYLLLNDPQNYKITVNTDNKTYQQVLSSGKGRDKFLTSCARQIWLIAALNSTTVTIQHKPGHLLVLADALSRYNDSPTHKSKADSLCKDLSLIHTTIVHSTDLLLPSL